MNKNPSSQQPIYIIGAGGIGIVIAWCLIKSGESVILVDNNQNKINHGKQQGLEISGHGALPAEFIHFDDWQPGTGSLILLCTKTYVNAEVLGRLPENVILLPIQNGFDPLIDAFPHDAEGIVSFVSECEPDKTITRITRNGDFHLGKRPGSECHSHDYLGLLAQHLRKPNLFPVHLVEDINPYKYAKLMYNAAISPLASSAGIDNSKLLNHPVAKRLFIGLLKENYTILKHAGMKLEKIGPMHPDWVYRILNQPLVVDLFSLFFRPSLKGTYCSMAPDIHTDRTEIEAYNGHLVTLAGDFLCPLNRASVAMVNKIVSNHLEPGIHHLDDMVAGLPDHILS